jgi:serine/threonine protein phosphatase PrpC
MNPSSEQGGLLTFATAQGQRDYQEDRAVHEWVECPTRPDGGGWLMAVFDGHRGAETADRASKALPSLFKTHLQAHARDIPQTLREVFLSLNQLVQGRLSGSTASVVFIPQDAQTIYLAVLGDSPVAILDAKGGVHIGPDHNVRTNLEARAAAEARGGIYQGGYLEDSDRPGVGLQFSRSLGDADLNRVLHREPEIQTVPFSGKGIVLVGSDGLFSQKRSGPEQLARILGIIREGADAEGVVKDAIARRTDDNVTAIVWRSL